MLTGRFEFTRPLLTNCLLLPALWRMMAASAPGGEDKEDEMKARVNGVEINYDLTGNGSKVIALTHGIGATGGDWELVVPHFTPRYKVLTWDVRGFGQSEKDAKNEHSIKAFAADLLALLKHIDAGPAYIMGHSMGGTITQRFIIDYPEQTAAAIICSTSSQVNERAKAVWESQADFIEKNGMRAWTEKSRPEHMTAEWLHEHPEQLEQEERRIRNNQNGAVYAQAARAVADYFYTEELKAVRVPALVIVGSEDKQTPPGGSVIISRTIPGARLHILDGLGHGLPREDPNRLAALTLAFLDEVEAGTFAKV